VTLEHGQDENLGALDAVDNPVRVEEHFADVLATTLGNVAASQGTCGGLPGTLTEALHPRACCCRIILRDVERDLDKIVLGMLGPAKLQPARFPILEARTASRSSSSTTRPASASARPCSMAATTWAS